MRNRKGLLFGAILLSILVALPVISGCAPEEAAPPPEEKVVTYLSLADYTGPIAGLNVPADSGVSDFFKDLNEKGGINGEIRVNFIGVDTRYDVARGVSAYKRYRTEKNLLVVNCISTPFGKAIAPMSEKDKVVQLAPGDGEFVANPGWQILWGVAFNNAFGACIDFVVADWKAKGNPGMPTIGYMSWDSAYGREPLRGGNEYAEQVGVNLLQPEFFPVGAADHTVWLQRIAQGGADYCFIAGVDPTPSNILRDAHKLGLTETIQFVDSSFWGPAEAVGVKLHPEATEGAWLCVFYLRGDEAWNHSLAEIGRKYRGEDVRNMFPAHYVVGMVWGLYYEAAVEAAVDDVGYDNLDGEAMLRGYLSLTGQDVSQGIEGPCTYSATNRQGSDVVKFYQVESGKVVPISDWIKVPDCVALHDFSE